MNQTRADAESLSLMNLNVGQSWRENSKLLRLTDHNGLAAEPLDVTQVLNSRNFPLSFLSLKVSDLPQNHINLLTLSDGHLPEAHQMTFVVDQSID